MENRNYVVDNYHNRRIIRKAETIGQYSLMKTYDALQAHGKFRGVPTFGTRPKPAT